MVRAFIALKMNDEIVDEIARIQEVLSGEKFVGKMTELENLHLTLKFLGEIDDVKLSEVKGKLKEIKFNEFIANLDCAGIFSIKGNPKIVWIKINGKGVFELQKLIDEKMKEVGFEMEKRFMSHLTIARVRYVKNRNSFRKYVEGIGVREVKFKVNEFKLIKSELKSPGPVYTETENYKLER